MQGAKRFALFVWRAPDSAPSAAKDRMNPLKDRITEDMKAAMRARETARLSTIRLLLAAIKQREVDERKT